MDGTTLGRILLVVGLIVAAAGGFMALGGKLPLGRLPGDISISSGNASFSFPITTCIVLSVLLSVILTVALRH
jgi:hypothetical protein